MGRGSFASLGILILLGACGTDHVPQSDTSEDTLTTSGVSATLDLQADWGSGYCAQVTLQNTSSSALTSWTVVIELNQATLSQLWNGTVTQSGSQIAVKPAAWNASVAPGATLAAFGFWATS